MIKIKDMEDLEFNPETGSFRVSVKPQKPEKPLMVDAKCHRSLDFNVTVKKKVTVMNYLMDKGMRLDVTIE